MGQITAPSAPQSIAPETWSQLYAEKFYRTMDFSSVEIPKCPDNTARLLYVYEPQKIIELAYSSLQKAVGLRGQLPPLERIMQNESCHRNNATVPYAIWIRKCPQLQPGTILGNAVGDKLRPTLTEVLLYLFTDDPTLLRGNQMIVCSETKIMSHFVCITISHGCIDVNYYYPGYQSSVPVVVMQV